MGAARRAQGFRAAFRVIAVLTTLLGLQQVSAQVGQGTFRVTVDDVERTAIVAVLDKSGQPYVSLAELADKLGGGCRVLPGHIQVDFARHTAWMQFGQTQVDASLRRFTLLHSILDEAGEPLMAVSDLGPFFEKAFGLRLSQVLFPREPAAPAETLTLPEPESVVPLPVQPPPGPESIPLPEGPAEKAQAPVPEMPIGVTGEGATGAEGDINVVIIDAGHGGNDAGCEGNSGLKEEDLALGIAVRLQRQLQGVGGKQAFLTRSSDVDVAQKERADFANSQEGDLLISVHAGAGFSPAAHGFEVFYSPVNDVWTVADGRLTGKAGSSECAARSRALAEALGPALAEATSAENRGVREVRCVLLKDVAMPAVLVEVGYLTNAAEEAMLETEAYQLRIAQGLAAGILLYAGTLPPQEAAP